MGYMTVTQMQIVQTKMEVLSVRAMMDFLETGKLALVINMHRYLCNNHVFVFVLSR